MMVSAEFMDIFGMMAFVIILIIGILIKIRRRKSPKHFLDYASLLLIIVGGLGLIVDSIIVVFNFVL